ASRALVVWAVTLPRPGVSRPAQEGEHRLAGGHGKLREAVAEVVEGEAQAVGQGLGIADEVGAIAEERLHLPRRLEMPLGVLGEQAAGRGQGPLLADAGEDVEEGASLERGMAGARAGPRPPS